MYYSVIAVFGFCCVQRIFFNSWVGRETPNQITAGASVNLAGWPYWMEVECSTLRSGHFTFVKNKPVALMKTRSSSL